MTTQHTPGPWTTARHGMPDQDKWAVGPGDTSGIAVVYGKANARLIAAAPDYEEAANEAVAELGEAYRIAREWSRVNEDAREVASHIDRATNALRAAIAKARGE